MSYLNLYRSYHRAKKDFIVEFYKRYEGKGGYWNAIDEWVSGETVHETVCEKHFDDLESALKFADEMQEEILKEERKRATGWKPEDIFWLSEFRINTNNSSKWNLIGAQINWGGSTYRMDMYVTIKGKEGHGSVQIDPRKVRNCSKCPYSNPIQKQIPQSFDRVYNILCQKQNNALVGEMVNGKCETGIPESCPLKAQFDLNSLPKTWEEFCKVSNISEKEHYISDYNGAIVTRVHRIRSYPVMRDPKSDCNVLPTKEEAEQHLAHMKLHQLRNFYRQGWKPNWRNKNEPKWCIEHYYGQYSVVYSENAILFLSFPSEAVAEKFLHNFRDLIAQAGDLI